MIKSGRSPAHPLQRFFPARGRLDGVSIDFEQRPEVFPNAWLVVDHHNFLFNGLFHSHCFLPGA